MTEKTASGSGRSTRAALSALLEARAFRKGRDARGEVWISPTLLARVREEMGAEAGEDEVLRVAVDRSVVRGDLEEARSPVRASGDPAVSARG